MLPLRRNAFQLYRPAIDVAPIVDEIRVLESRASWIPKSANGGWSAITIKSKDGTDCPFLSAEGIEEGAAAFAYTDDGAGCPVIRSLLDGLGTDVYLARLLKLKPGQRVKYHTDDVVFQDTSRVVRLHLPLVTCPRCVLRFGIPLREPERGYNVWDAKLAHEVHIPEGELWYTNVNALHSVANGGERDRIHLVVDVKPQKGLADALREWGSQRELM